MFDRVTLLKEIADMGCKCMRLLKDAEEAEIKELEQHRALEKSLMTGERQRRLGNIAGNAAAASGASVASAIRVRPRAPPNTTTSANNAASNDAGVNQDSATGRRLFCRFLSVLVIRSFIPI